MKGIKTKLKERADRLTSKIVRKDGVCEWCGTTTARQYQAAHIFSRRFLSTRWDFDNLLCLCPGCHRKGHDQPIEFAEFVKEKMGEEKYNQLRKKAKMEIGSSYIEDLVDLINKLKKMK